MRIGVDIRCLQDSVRTGVGEYAWQILKNLFQDESITLTGFANAAHKIDLPPGLADLMDIQRGRLPNKIMNFLQWRRLGKPIDQLLNFGGKPLDVLWLPNPSFINVSNKVPVVLTIHDLSFIHYPYFFPKKGRLWYFPAVKKLLKSGLSGNFLIVAVSKHTAEDLIDLYPNLANYVQVAPPGLDERYFFPVTEEKKNSVKHKYKLPNKFFFSLGTIEPRKNYSLLLEVYEKLYTKNPNLDYDLIIAGSWGWNYRPIKDILKKLKSRNRIKFINYIADNDKPALYQSASLFLFPSLYEGIGLPVLEAMASSVPVISSNSSSLPEIIGNAGTLISPHLSDAWTERLLNFTEHPNKYDELSKLGQLQAKKYSWAATARTYKQYFNELTNK